MAINDRAEVRPVTLPRTGGSLDVDVELKTTTPGEMGSEASDVIREASLRYPGEHDIIVGPDARIRVYTHSDGASDKTA